MLCGAKSFAAVAVRPTRADFDATYATIVGVPRRAATLAVLTIAPPPDSRIAHPTACSTLKLPTTFMSIT
eukprot:scaffold175492_cov35-Tisochrysis_lutea.AAC.2